MKKKRLRIAEAHESQTANQPEYIACTVEFDCKETKLRQGGGLPHLARQYLAKLHDRMCGPAGSGAPGAWPAIRPAPRTPAAHQMLHLVDVYRPVSFVRQFLWKDMQKPPLANEVDT